MEDWAHSQGAPMGRIVWAGWLAVLGCLGLLTATGASAALPASTSRALLRQDIHGVSKREGTSIPALQQPGRTILQRAETQRLGRPGVQCDIADGGRSQMNTSPFSDPETSCPSPSKLKLVMLFCGRSCPASGWVSEPIHCKLNSRTAYNFTAPLSVPTAR